MLNWLRKRAAKRQEPVVANPVFEKAARQFGGVVVKTVSENEVIIESGVAIMRAVYYSGTIKAWGYCKGERQMGATGIWWDTLGWSFMNGRISESEWKARIANIDRRLRGEV